MPRFPSPHVLLGLTCIAFALLGLVIWVPLDTDTGLIEKVRRRVSVGDALAPTVAFVFVLLGGALVVWRDANTPDQPRLTMHNLLFVAGLIAIFGLGFAVMRWAGPLAVQLLGDGDHTYRALRDTAPWKFIGFFLGGSGLIATLISLIERRFSARAVLIGIAATLALILIYDVPFDDLILPPNGDV